MAALEELDCKRLNCPMPIVKISKAIRALKVGEQLRVEATDPAFLADVQAWTERMGQRLDKTEDSGPVKVALITKVKA